MSNKKPENILTFIPKDQKTIFVPKIKKTEFSYVELIVIFVVILMINFGTIYAVKEFTLVRDINTLKSYISEIDSKNQNIYPAEGIVETIKGYSGLLDSQYKLNIALSDIQKRINSDSKISSISYIKDTRTLELELDLTNIAMIESQLVEFRKSEYISNVNYQDIGVGDRNSGEKISTKFTLILQ